MGRQIQPQLHHLLLRTYPSVLRKPQTLPSANSDTMSPKCKKLAEPIILSPIVKAVLLVSSTQSENAIQNEEDNDNGKEWQET